VGKDTLYIVMPAYNEEACIEQVVRGWHAVVLSHGDEDSRLMVVDDGSRDSTFSILEGLSSELGRLVPVTKPNAGHGPAVLHGYAKAIEAGAGWVFQTDSDGQTDPAEFDGFWSERGENDFVFGVRRNRGDGFKRELVEKVLCLILFLFFGERIPDANAPFRLMKADRLAEHISHLPADYAIPNAMVTVYAKHAGDRCLFKEISFGARESGKNSIGLRRIARIGIESIKGFAALRRELHGKSSRSGERS
jgi:glycosyltransferase involved in cell wall biosynthesis